jgi:hypothetical protein
MKIIKSYLFVVISFAFIFYSCESNDGIIIQSSSNLKSQSKVLIELFTNTSCIPCVQSNLYLDGINNLSGVTINDTNVVIIRIHTTLFANDPFYDFNPADNFARQQYYVFPAFANPKGYLMGLDSSLGNFNQATWTTEINNRLAKTNSFSINFIVTYDSVSRNGSLDYEVGQLTGAAVNDLVLHIAVTEGNLFFNAQNGETDFENTLRDLITQGTGEAISISPGQSSNFSKNFTLMNGIDHKHADIIIFVQSVSSKEIFGVEKKPLN